MAITYPGTLDVFTNPAGTNTLDVPSHSTQHSNANDAIEAIETVIGTTAGTGVLTNFTTGDLPVRQDTSNVLQDVISGGTINSSTFGTATLQSPSTTGTDSGTATLTNKTLTSPLFQGLIDAWIDANDSWSYASATTITIPAGGVSKYKKGDKIKLTQTTVKYFYITTVADTLLTVTGGSDYTVADAAITSPYYSHQDNPIGFPEYFNTVAVAFSTTTLDDSSTGQISSSTSRFIINGSFCTHFVTTGQSYKVGTNNLVLWTFPAGLPTSISMIMGNGYYGSINTPFVVARSSASNFYLFTSDTVADNTSIATFDIGYQFLF